MNNNDERIIELKKNIAIAKDKLESKSLRFSPITNCVLLLDNNTYNINVLNNIDELTLLIVKLNTYLMSSKDLGIGEFEISGYLLSDWIKDIKNKVEIIKLKEEKKLLDANEKKLESLLSQDKKVELQIDEIENSFKLDK